MNTSQLRTSARSDEDRCTSRMRASRRRPKMSPVAEDEVSKVSKIAEGDLLAAISSLYSDSLRPFGRLVRKRLGEMAALREEPLADGDLGRLRQQCEECSNLLVESGEGSEWSVLLPNRESIFVDVYSTEDVYPEILWLCIQDHLGQLSEAGGSLPGGRYSCAYALLAAGLPVLQGCSLGEVCHIVQLAMTEKKLLGYSDGTIMPYERSNSMMKDEAAELCIGSSTSCQIPLASWTHARACMVDVLDSALRKGKHQVPISTLKRLFRSRFHIELSETALGYTKLSDLLQDKVFGDICSVKLLERGYVLLPRKEIFARLALSELKELPCAHVQIRQSSFEQELSAPVNIVHNTFIQAKRQPAVTSRRAQSLPKHFGSHFVESEDDFVHSEEGSTDVASGSLSPTLTASPLWTPRQSEIDGVCPSWNMEELYLDSLATSQGGGFDWTMDHCLAEACEASLCHFSFPYEAWTLESPLCGANWAAAGEIPLSTSATVEEPVHLTLAQTHAPECLSKRACDGSVVRKTFIEVASPRSPGTWHCRSQSVPRNLGHETCFCDDVFIMEPLAVSNVDGLWKGQSALVSPAATASPWCSPRCVGKNAAPSWSPNEVKPMNGMCEPSKCVLRLAQFL